MIKRLLREERGFTLVELLVVIAILGVLFGIVSLTLSGVGGDAEATVNAAELGVVQSAVDIYVAAENVTAVPTRSAAAVIAAGATPEADAPFGIYLRNRPTKCTYSWTADGTVAQGACP